MTEVEFFYWLYGFIKLEDNIILLTHRQLLIIKNHLNLTITIDGKISSMNQPLYDLLKDITPDKFPSNILIEQVTKLIITAYTENSDKLNIIC